jgi:hypothetical protein
MYIANLLQMLVSNHVPSAELGLRCAFDKERGKALQRAKSIHITLLGRFYDRI